MGSFSERTRLFFHGAGYDRMMRDETSIASNVFERVEQGVLDDRPDFFFMSASYAAVEDTALYISTVSLLVNESVTATIGTRRLCVDAPRFGVGVRVTNAQRQAIKRRFQTVATNELEKSLGLPHMDDTARLMAGALALDFLQRNKLG